MRRVGLTPNSIFAIIILEIRLKRFVDFSYVRWTTFVMETMSCCGRHFAAAVFVSKDETFWWGGFKQNKTKEIQKNAESVRKCKTIKSNQKQHTLTTTRKSSKSSLSMNNKNHCVCACVRQAKNVACVGRKGEQSQWLLMNVFSFFSSFFPPKKNKQTNEEDDGWKLVCVSIGGRGTSDGHSLLSAQPYPRKRIPFGAVANGPGGRSKEDRRWHPTTDPGTINTHTKTGFLFSYCYKKKNVFCRSNPCRVYVCVHELTEIEKNRYNSAMEATLSYFCPLENNIETKKIWRF